ncbi:MAG TPA: hypothetical protein VHS58_18295, partial [Acetobacteraceae bacterium]|nr:hypothetical protein [Acetobacteraceae bacterium]
MDHERAAPRGRRTVSFHPAGAAVPDPCRLGGIARRFAATAARVQAGTLRPPRPRATPRQPSVRRPYERLPRRFGWLVALVPGDAVGFGLNLVQLLGEPEMQ